jgi:hypothetical protein
MFSTLGTYCVASDYPMDASVCIVPGREREKTRRGTPEQVVLNGRANGHLDNDSFGATNFEFPARSRSETRSPAPNAPELA